MQQSLISLSSEKKRRAMIGYGSGSAGDGITLNWAHPYVPLDPVPSDATELIFTIPRFGDWEGPWEFRIPLE